MATDVRMRDAGAAAMYEAASRAAAATGRGATSRPAKRAGARNTPGPAPKLIPLPGHIADGTEVIAAETAWRGMANTPSAGETIGSLHCFKR